MLIRKGKCKRCGQCCQFLDTTTGKMKPCKHLEFREGIAFCKIHENKPQCCKNFPPTPEVFKHKTFSKEIKNCGFYFVEENDK